MLKNDIFEKVCRTKQAIVINFHIRTTKTSSNATAVQVVRYVKRRRIIVKHIGSSHNLDELKQLKLLARDYIDKLTKQPPLFPKDQSNNLVNIKNFQF